MIGFDLCNNTSYDGKIKYQKPSTIKLDYQVRLIDAKKEERMLNEKDAYKAMIIFLEKFYSISKSDDIGGLLGSMMLLKDEKPADSALWEDWLEAVQRIIDES